MTGFSQHAPESDPAVLVRMIGRLALMIVELRDEYVETHRDDALDQIERRIAEMTDLHTQLRQTRELRDAAHH